MKGKVTALKDYGAFVDLGGIEGLIHMSELSHGHAARAGDVLAVGQEVDAKILKIEEGKGTQKKISLSLKALASDPWEFAERTLKEGEKVKGRVLRIQPFGAFVQIMPGVDGLVHISNMAVGQRIKDPREIVNEGDEIEATIVTIDWKKKRIGLSLVKSRQELADEFSSGQVVDGTVDRVESFGVFVKLPSGARGPAANGHATAPI